MFRHTIIALALLGIAGTATLAPATPAKAFFICAKDSRHKNSDFCKARARIRADINAFLNDLFKPRRKRR